MPSARGILYDGWDVFNVRSLVTGGKTWEIFQVLKPA
ncbi:MAG: hypothetical protein CM15mP87_06080 [Candidatus Neomarinimicrobiota bacterium]|nr:MAG: hypothetical protein CM15mP87_06080 [Candidatus Neomarinimicrobiota bacterium]